MAPTRHERRVYSWAVVGFRLHDGNREDMRSASVVAFDRDEAIDEAKRLIGVDESEATYRWNVSSVMEIQPKEARDWIAWHALTREEEAASA